MNIWALAKEDALKALLIQLMQVIDQQAIKVIDPTPEDKTSIGLAKPDEPAIWAYVYTYGQRPAHYGVHLQFPHLPDNQVDGAIDAQENVSFTALVDILITHLEIPASAIQFNADV